MHRLLAETLLEYETLRGDEVRELVLKGKKPNRHIINDRGEPKAILQSLRKKLKQNHPLIWELNQATERTELIIFNAFELNQYYIYSVDSTLISSYLFFGKMNTVRQRLHANNNTCEALLSQWSLYRLILTIASAHKHSSSPYLFVRGVCSKIDH